jgi:hypothetical protein
MNKDLFKALEALCWMWSQYCEFGHMFMGSGEYTMEVLSEWQLLKDIDGDCAKVDNDRLEFLRQLVSN